ncbi:carboxypeptidase-like regulatory domain-containing protein, partial [bacterium]|nr:carboxypeptidase-like regulatory domain-containing protein [bacterium]
MKKFLYIITLILFSLSVFAASISGYVTDQETGETIIGVNIMVEGSSKGAATDVKGFFIIRNINPGDVVLHFSHIAYEELFRTINLKNKNIFLENISLKPRSIRTEAVEIIGQRGSIIQRD